MSKKIKCIDGITRTENQYYQWLRNLMELYECERNDLTDVEYQALLQEGCIDE